jgi:hypothetical protein
MLWQETQSSQGLLLVLALLLLLWGPRAGVPSQAGGPQAGG